MESRSRLLETDTEGATEIASHCTLRAIVEAEQSEVPPETVQCALQGLDTGSHRASKQPAPQIQPVVQDPSIQRFKYRVPSTEARTTYVELLTPRGHGFPLWDSEPRLVLDSTQDKYITSEVEIGDVGFLDQRGGFTPLFNVVLPEDHQRMSTVFRRTSRSSHSIGN